MDTEAPTDLNGWLAELAARLQVAGHLVVQRALAGPASAGAVSYTGPADVGGFLDLLRDL